MVSLVLTLAMSFHAGSDAPSETWVRDLLQTKSAQAILAAHAKLGPRPPFPATLVPARPGEDSGHLKFSSAFAAILHDAVRTTSELIEDSQFEEAYQCISDVDKAHPEFDAAIVDWIIEAELLAGHYDKAYEDSVVRVASARSDNNDGRYLPLSIASAAKGQVFPGQAEYCAKLTQNHLINQGSAVVVRPPTGTQSAHQVMVLSAVALGSSPSPGFLELALRMDPVNDLAARQAIYYYLCKGRYSDVRRVAASVIDHLDPGESSTYYVETIQSVARLKDKPLHPVIKP